MRGIWVGDLHLDRLKKLYSNALELQEAEICKPLEYALSQGVKFVVFAGDIGEHPTLSESALLVLLNVLIKYGKHLNIHLILGNHDFAETGVHSLKVLELLKQQKKIFPQYKILQKNLGNQLMPIFWSKSKSIICWI